MLANLVGNAVKFTEEGRVELNLQLEEIRHSRGNLSVDVADTGVGIASEQQRLIFEPYAQADEATTRRFGGTGLSLSICKELVELMGGHIRLHSEPGIGTTIGFTLPVQLAPAVLHDEVISSAGVMDTTARGSSTAVCVLVVDDHPGNRFIIAAQLGELGVSTEVVADGEAALELLGRQAFDLVLMDCHMPGLNGYEVTRRLRAREDAGAHLPVIAVSAATDATHIDECMECGMDGSLAKPLQLKDLASILALWIDGWAAPPQDDGRPAGTLRATDLRALFGEDIDSDMRALHTALEKGDKPSAVQIAHRIRGAALMAGATAVASAVVALDNSLRAAQDESSLQLRTSALTTTIAKWRSDGV